jgi:hypothetical protein
MSIRQPARCCPFVVEVQKSAYIQSDTRYLRRGDRPVALLETGCNSRDSLAVSSPLARRFAGAITDSKERKNTGRFVRHHQDVEAKSVRRFYVRMAVSFTAAEHPVPVL